MIDPAAILADPDAAYALSDRVRWALVIENVVYVQPGFKVENALFYWGNCLTTGDPGAESNDWYDRSEHIGRLPIDERLAYGGGTPVVVVSHPFTPSVPGCVDPSHYRPTEEPTAHWSHWPAPPG